jgi:hypothetical protein
MIARLVCHWFGHRFRRRRRFEDGLERGWVEVCARCGEGRLVYDAPEHPNCRCMPKGPSC